MINKNTAVCAFILQKEETKTMSLRKLSYLVYLSDWASALTNRDTITSFKWSYDIISGIKPLDLNELDTKFFKKLSDIHSVSQVESIMFVKNGDIDIESLLTTQEIHIINFILKKLNDFYFNDLMLYVKDTKPLNEPEIYTDLNLKESALSFLG